MNIQNNNSNNLKFRAKLGPNADKLFTSQAQRENFSSMFNKVFKKALDKNTILDITEDSYLKISHKKIPGEYKTSYKLGKEPLIDIIGMCPAETRRFESKFFKAAIDDMKKNNSKLFLWRKSLYIQVKSFLNKII